MRAKAARALLRVNAEMIDRFVNEAGELSIARSRIEGEMANFKQALGDLTENIARMRAQLREIELASEGQMQSTIKLKEEHGERFDPLELDRFSRMQELTRFLAESLGDVITLHQGLQKNLDETELAIHAQARLNRELQQGLMGVRLVPARQPLRPLLPRSCARPRKELDKKANLELEGHADGARPLGAREDHRALRAPAAQRHRARHREARRAHRRRASPRSARSPSTRVQRGNEVVLTVSDDGAGLELRAHPREGDRIGTARDGRGAARGAARAIHLHVGIFHRRPR